MLGCGRFHFEPTSDAAQALDAEERPCEPLPGCAGAVAFRCPTGRCYTVCADAADWPTQAARCTAADMHLATIRSADDEACISAQLPAMPTSFWIGLMQSAGATQPTEGWSWITGEPLGYANWLDPDAMPPPNPDDFDGVEDGFEQCAWKNGPARMQWEDASCDNQAPGLICER